MSDSKMWAFESVLPQINEHCGGQSRAYWLQFDFSLLHFFSFASSLFSGKTVHHHRREACAWWHSRCVAHVLTKCLFINLISAYDHRLVMQELDAGAWTLQHHPAATVDVSLGLIHLHLLTVKTHLSFIPVVTSWPYYSLSWIKKWK